MSSTRRRFLQQSALAAGYFTLAGTSRARAVAPSDKIHVACVGVRGQGGSLLNTFAGQSDVVVTHIADIDEEVRGRRGAEIEKKTGKLPRLVTDYRTLLDNPSIHAFVIGTPDHWHALPTIHACQAGKDVYVEKPDGHNINEGKAMVAAARKHNRMVQMGTQARSATHMAEARKFIQSGALGKVLFAKAWETDRQGEVRRQDDSDPPKGVDYDLWLGPAPLRKFNRNRFHGSWRWFFDYGCGDLGNDGVHRIDYCRILLGLDELPQAISASGGKFYFDDAQEWPDTQMITYDFPRLVMTYEMRLWSRPRMNGLTEGAAVHGENGWMIVSTNSCVAYDAANKEMKRMDGKAPLEAHVRNFLDAVRSRKRETLNQEIASGHVSSVLCHAGNIAWRTGKKLRLDAKTETFNDPEADKYLGREYRKGFELPRV